VKLGEDVIADFKIRPRFDFSSIIEQLRPEERVEWFRRSSSSSPGDWTTMTSTLFDLERIFRFRRLRPLLKSCRAGVQEARIFRRCPALQKHIIETRGNETKRLIESNVGRMPTKRHGKGSPFGLRDYSTTSIGRSNAVDMRCRDRHLIFYKLFYI
jgi:hypothetical protein